MATNSCAQGIESVALIGNYLPRQCGIATFTSDIATAVAGALPDASCWVVAMNDRPDGYAYPPRVRFEIQQDRLVDYSLAAQFLNMQAVDVVNVQHEYGIFGGRSGRHLLTLLGDLEMPVVTTLHTVLEEPSPDQREVLEGLVRLSDRLIVMSQGCAAHLREIYGAPADKIAVIGHGIPTLPFVDPYFFKDQFGVEGRTVILTFGLLSPGKGIEHVIEALPPIVEEFPDVAYIVLGATHPHVRQRQGEEYRVGLQQRARELGVHRHIHFHNRFVTLDELCAYLGAADLYVTPYLNAAQAVSGTLAYALGAGKAVVSTPYRYAVEMLADERGVLVPFRDAPALAGGISGLLRNPVRRHAMRKRAYAYTREMVWPAVAREYLRVFREARAERKRRPRAAVRPGSSLPVPPLRLDHMRALTDHTGILQHARYAIPWRRFGYCTDDNARALMVALQTGEEALTRTYLSFLDDAFNEASGRFRNFLSYDRRWLEEVGSEDSHGRAVWALGTALAQAEREWMLGFCMRLFHRALPALESFTSPRSIAFALVGLSAYLRRFEGDRGVRAMAAALLDGLHFRFQQNGTADWPWLEDILTYDNARIPCAMLLCGQVLERRDAVDCGLRALDWLMALQTAAEGHFTPVGNRGWYPRYGTMARFDQQPLEAHGSIDACVAAWQVGGDAGWLERAQCCFEWYQGRNDLGTPLYDLTTGGCRDGLHSQGCNANQGAESTLSWLLSLLVLREHLARLRSLVAV